VAGTNNVAIGHNAIFDALNKDYTNNTAVGSSSLKALVVGGNNNTAIGYFSGATNTTGTNNTYLGEGTDAANAALSNSTAVGSGSKITKSDQIVLGKSTSPPEVYIPGRVGVGNNNPMTMMQIGPDLATDSGYDYDENALLVTHPTPISDTAVNDPMTVLYLARDGISSISNSVRAAFKLSKYEYAGAQNPKSRLDIGLLESYNDNEPSVLTLLGNGEVQIPGSLVVQGTATAPTVAGTGDSTTNIATTAFVQAVVATVDAGSMATNIASKANKNDAALTGTPTAPTAASTIDTDQIATTKFVQERITTLIGGAPDALNTLKEITDALTGTTVVAAITTTIADNATAIANLGSSVSSGSTFSKNTTGTEFAHYDKKIHIGAATEPTEQLQVTGNITATGNIALSGNLSKIYNGVEHVIFNSPTTNAGIIGIGKNSMTNATGGDNVAIGSNTLNAVTTAVNNTAVGSGALSASTGSSNTAVGKGSGAGDTTGSHNTFIGFDTKVSTNGPSDSTAIGFNATITESNQIVLGTSTEKVFIPGSMGIGNTPSEKLEVTGNIKASGDVIFSGNLKQDDGAGNLTDFQGGAFSIEAGGFAHYSDNIHIGGSTAPADGSKLEVTGDIKLSGAIRQW